MTRPAISSALSAAQSGGTGLVTPAFEPWAAIEYRETVTGPQEWTVFFDRDEISTQIAEAFGFTWKRGQIHYHRADASPRARRRCPLCNPRTGPRKLPIDGHAYARRRAARKRR
jgi:hypothetical protein